MSQLAQAALEVTWLFIAVNNTHRTISDEHHSSWPVALFSVELDWFELWAQNMGFFVTGHGSLDYRVREAESLAAVLLRFLIDLGSGLVEGKHDCVLSR